MRRGFRYVFVAVLCSLCAAPAAHAAARKTVTGELSGCPPPARWRRGRLRRRPRHLRGRAREGEEALRRAPAGAGRRAARPRRHGRPRPVQRLAAARAVPHAGAQRRVLDDPAADRQRHARVASRRRSSCGSSTPATGCRSSGWGRSARSTRWARASATTPRPTRCSARRSRWPPRAPAGWPGSTCSRSTASARRGPARSPRAPGCRRWRAPPSGSAARPRSSRSCTRAWASSRPRRPRACGSRTATAPTTCSTPGCRT